MSLMVNTLKSRLQNAVPARSGVPGDSQYEQAIRDAVNNFNGRATRLKVTTLTVQAGVAVYALPADCVRCVELSSPGATEGNVVVSGYGLIPVPESLSEYVGVEGGQIRITPTPLTTCTRELWYGAGHVESGTPPGYAEMTEREAHIILLLAQSIALGYRANAEAGQITSYQIGDERVSRERVLADLQARVNSLAEQYQAAVARYVGAQT